MAQSITIPIRCRTRRAVSFLSSQIAIITSRTCALSMPLTAMSPIFGNALCPFPVEHRVNTGFDERANLRCALPRLRQGDLFGAVDSDVTAAPILLDSADP
ncbi:hypothetical protein IP81_18760 [Novosphingobium sp. AAP83]|nr:hypothetical protein IP81_18760 [Novosphingobium sp. AAP83]